VRFASSQKSHHAKVDCIRRICVIRGLAARKPEQSTPDVILHGEARASTVTLVADRFLRSHDGWYDIATASRVEVSVTPAGSLREQIDWAERCAMLARLRHPLVNSLLDFGLADARSFFEAYASSGPIAVGRCAASRLVTHASRFLAAHGVTIAAAQAPFTFRAVRLTSSRSGGRPLGLVIQPRRAIDTVAELLAASLPGGIRSVGVTGAEGAGLRTLRTFAAQRARIEGYVPVCPAALERWPELLDRLEGRHVCLLTSGQASASERAAAATLAARLALRSARPHICLALDRAAHPHEGAVHLEPMGGASMTSMLYLDPDYGPSEGDVFDAVRRSGGLPGRLLAELGSRPFESGAVRVFTVHESTVSYGERQARNASPVPPRRSRIGSVLRRASNRASALASAGRHVAATRLLQRAARVLQGRGEFPESAACWRQLAWIARNRGATERALECAGRAAEADGSAEGRTEAGCVTAVCWTDQGRLLEAEASLRTLAAAAAAIDNATLRTKCALALARVLCWDRRGHEALSLAEAAVSSRDPEILAEALVIRARAHLLMSDLPAAMTSARDAERHAQQSGSVRLAVAAHRVTAEAHHQAGDLDGVRRQTGAGLVAASAAHLPLAALRFRAVMLQALRDLGGPPDEIARLHAGLGRALGRDLPVLVRRVLEHACGLVAIDSGTRVEVRAADVSHVERFLDIAQRAESDQMAVSGILSAICEHTAAASVAILVGPEGRTLATVGRSWRDRPVAGARALASGLTVPCIGQPPEAGEPIRYGGELIGSIGARWIPGATVLPTAHAAMRAGSIAAAGYVRALLDVAPALTVPAVTGDLLGECPVAIALREAIERASRAPFPVLIEGESGSGKELVARAIHRLGSRRTRRFCAINCAALSDELIEAELFGHARGAFTGAATDRAGLFEEADGGTLFLDEVGELSSRAQAKLLRVLQEGEVRRVGENLPRRVDVRIVAATNRRLAQEAADGRFRTDLRFRLDVLRIVVPPLRDRVADVPLLAQHFWREACARVGSRATLGPDALAALSRYDWPGNVRELQNVIAWLSVHAPRRGRVNAGFLPAQLASSPFSTGSFEAAREEFERRYVRAALAQAGGQRKTAARALGVSRQGLAKMLRRLGIEK
jgi:transcriptional regulator with AAA-type ATPase domain/tetratricopeptide (TPR) repeat protein